MACVARATTVAAVRRVLKHLNESKLELTRLTKLTKLTRLTSRLSSDVCLPVGSAVAPPSDGGMSPASGRSGWRTRRRMDVGSPSGKAAFILFHVSSLSRLNRSCSRLQVSWATPASARPTAPPTCAAPATSGATSVSRCCRRGRCARGAASGTTWSSSRGVPVATPSPAGRCRRSNPRSLHQATPPRPHRCCLQPAGGQTRGFTCARKTRGHADANTTGDRWTEDRTPGHTSFSQNSS